MVAFGGDRMECTYSNLPRGRTSKVAFDRSEVEHIYSKLVLVYVAQISFTFHENCPFPGVTLLKPFGKWAMTTLKNITHDKTT